MLLKSLQKYVLMQFGLYRDGKGTGMSYTVWWLGFGLDIPEFGSRQGQEIYLFSITSKQALWPTRPRTQWVTVALSCGWKQAERENDHSRSSSAELFLHSFVYACMTCIGTTLLLFFFFWCDTWSFALREELVCEYAEYVWEQSGCDTTGTW